MKRDELIRRIAKAAKQTDASWTFEREGGKHTIYRCNGQIIPIPRHREINELTALAILDDAIQAMRGQ